MSAENPPIIAIQGASSADEVPGLTGRSGLMSLEFDDSDWLFTGDVRIRDATTEINADRATLRFVAHRLREA